MIVTVEHLRSVRGRGWCMRGARAWFARHGLDWSAFVRDGIDEQALRATGCGMAEEIIAHAHQEARRG